MAMTAVMVFHEPVQANDKTGQKIGLEIACVAVVAGIAGVITLILQENDRNKIREVRRKKPPRRKRLKAA